ncbi:MAG: motility associated factor glycosyltransferase family protein, partial [Thermodesulfobacteriota bacterium]
MTIFEKNCAAIAKQDSILAERLRAFHGNVAKLYRGKNREFVLRYNGRLFNSQYEPWKEADQQAGDIVGKKPDCVALFGLGCGYLMRSLLKKGTQKIFVYEPSMEILKGVLMKIDLSREFSGQRVYLANYIGPFIARVQQFTEGFDNIIGYHTMPYRLSFQGELKEFLIKIENAHTSQKVGIKTEIDSRLDWLMNYFANLDAFSAYPSVDVMKDKFKGVPMVIVGAGPSLRKNVELLAGIKDRAFIVSAITAYKSLLSYGIVPHAVISGEKVDLDEYFEGGEADSKIRLILSEVSHPNMFKRDARGKFIFYSPYIALSLEQASLWGAKSFVSIGGSVTTAVFDMGVMFGCDPIIFLGQDLAFDRDMTHVGGGVYDKQRIIVDKEKGLVKVKEHYISGHQRTITHKLQWLKGLNNEPVASKYDWVTFHQWFERYTALLKEQFPHIRVYNATEGGAFIKGMEHLTLKEVIARDLKEPVAVEELLRQAEAMRPEVDIKGLIKSFAKLK